MLKQVGVSGQVVLGKKFAGQFFELSTRDDGVLELRPMVVIPQSQAWAHTPEIKQRLDESQAWMAANPPRSDNTEQILAQIEAHIAAKEAEAGGTQRKLKRA
jgi:hypothetical protein